MSAFFMTISMCMSDNIEFFSVITLVDITNTGVTRNKTGHDIERDQQRNWETVLQVIGLRAQPIIIQGPASDVISADIVEELFGEMYSGKQRIWVANFGIEHKGAFKKDNDDLLLLKDDFNQVPIICGLNETARFILPIFYSFGAIKNIVCQRGRIDFSK